MQPYNCIYTRNHLVAYLKLWIFAEKVRELKQQDRPNLHVMGNADLFQTLFKNDLVDELQLRIVPITLGTGKRLFTHGTIPAAFKVTESQISPNGIIIVNYERDGEVKTDTIGA